MLNRIWTAFFIIAFFFAVIKLVVYGEFSIFQEITKSVFGMAKTGFEISIGLTGVMTLWLGIMKIGEKGGAIKILAKIIGPFFSKIFPDIPKDHPALGSILMNFSANILGLDNAATPLGLKGMKEMQEINPKKDTASNSQIMFLVLNTSALTLIPISIMVYRAELGAADPTDIFIPILITTFVSSIAGLLAVSFYQKINLFQKEIFIFLTSISLFLALLIIYFSNLSQNSMQEISSFIANFIIFSVIVGFIALAAKNKINVYEAFIEGAKEGFNVAISIIPYLVAMLIAIGVFRASGAMDVLIDGISYLLKLLGLPTDFTPALPTALMKPLSGSGARGLMVDAMKTYGADSFIGRLTSIMQGSTDTTFYVIALYFGSVGIKKTRHAISSGLFADFVGMITAIFLGYFFFS
jgi:spore maturation protein SpmA